MDALAAAGHALDRGSAVTLVTVVAVSGNPPSRVGLVLSREEDDTVHGSLGCDGFDNAASIDARRSIQDGTALRETYPWDDNSSITVSVKSYRPGDRLPVAQEDILELLVVGVGPVARALIALGEVMGYHTRVAAGPGSPKIGEFWRVDEIIVTPNAGAVEALRPGSNTYVVICGHDHEFSIPVLRALLPTPVPYIGMLGSRRHTGGLVDELLRDGFTEVQLSRLHTPVGVPISSETPEEIALSALAQIVAVRRSK